ncbi:MAG: hypothetical protein ABIG61_04920 [Planctomycetota bacterium]
MTKRGGYSLMEMMILVSVTAVMMGVCAKPLRMLLYDMPYMHRSFQTTVSISNMLRMMRSDIDSAVAIPDEAGGIRADEETLLIDSGKDIILYRKTDEKIVREILDLKQAGDSVLRQIWPVPYAKVGWSRWQQGGRAYAVEISTSIKQRIGERWTDRFGNSHVFFVNRVKTIREQK